MPRREVRLPTTEPCSVGRTLDLDLHHRLQQHGPRGGEVLPHAGPGTDLEGHFRTVDVVIRTVLDDHLQADDRIAGHRPLVDHLPETLLDGRNEVLGDPPADDLVLELERLRGVFRQRLHAADDVGVLARAAGLLAVLGVELAGLRRRLAVVDLRRADLDLHAVFAADALDVDLQVQLAHAGHDRLGRLFVGEDVQRGVFAAEAVQGLAELVGPVALGRGDGHLDDRLGHEHALQRAIGILRAIGIAAGGVQAQHGHDVARLGRVDVFALVGVHAHDAAVALLAAGALVVVAFTLLDRALVDPHEGQRAVGVFHHLEGHADHRLGRIGRQRHLLVRIVVGQGLDRALQRRGQVAGHRVQQRLHALVLVGRADEDGRQLLAEHRLADDAIDQIQRHRLFGQQQLHHLVAVHRDGFQHVLPGGLDRFGHVGRDRFDADVLAVGAVEIEGLLAEQIDDALEVVLQADGKLHQHGVAVELVAKLLDDFVRIAAGAVHLVDEGQAGHAVSPHLAVDSQRLGLHAAHGAEDEDRPVQHAETSLDLDGEIDVARRIDEVDVVAVPLDRGSGAGDGDAALALQFHVVHGGAGAAAFDLLHAVDAAGVEEDPLAEGGLARVDVGGNADIAEFRQVHG